jgi:hypothetical protein
MLSILRLWMKDICLFTYNLATIFHIFRVIIYYRIWILKLTMWKFVEHVKKTYFFKMLCLVEADKGHIFYTVVSLTGLELWRLEYHTNTYLLYVRDHQILSITCFIQQYSFSCLVLVTKFFRTILISLIIFLEKLTVTQIFKKLLAS